MNLPKGMALWHVALIKVVIGTEKLKHYLTDPVERGTKVPDPSVPYFSCFFAPSLPKICYLCSLLWRERQSQYSE